MASTATSSFAARDDVNHKPSILAFNVVMTVAAFVVVCLRFYSRTLQRSVDRQSPALWWDDWLALAVLPCVLAATVLLCLSAHLVLDLSQDRTLSQDLVTSAKLMFANYFVHDIALTLGRGSILLLYTRFFRTSPAWFDTGVYITHMLNVAWFLAAVLAKALICRPTNRFWDRFLPGSCGSLSSMWLGVGIIDALVDVVILGLPVPLVLNLGLSRGRQMLVACLFACGLSVLVISIGRTITTIQTSTVPDTARTPNTSIPTIFFLSAELPMLLLAITLPSLAQLLTKPTLRFRTSKPTPLPTINDAPTSQRPESMRPTGSESARSSYLSSNYTAYAEYSGAEKRYSLGSVVPDENDKDIHVENVVTISTH